MKTASLVKVLGTLILLVASAIPAAADEFSFVFQSPDVTVTGDIFTSDTPNIFGNLDVTAITGTTSGTGLFSAYNGSIGPLLANPNQPNVFVDPATGNFWDNNLIPTAPFVTSNGIGFNFNGDQLVLFSGVLGPQFPLSEGLFSLDLNTSAIGSLTIPEPATWALLLCGLLGFGLFAAMRRPNYGSV